MTDLVILTFLVFQTIKLIRGLTTFYRHDLYNKAMPFPPHLNYKIY